MRSCPGILSLLALALTTLPLHFAYASGDRITFNNCMATEMAKLKEFCDSRAYPDPDDPMAKQECMKNTEVSWRQTANQKCSAEAYGEMERNAHSPADEGPKTPDSTNSGCIATATRSCPSAPLPPRRPRGLTAPTPPTPPTRAAAPTSPSPPPRPAQSTPRPTPQQDTQRQQPSQTDRNNRQAVSSAQETTPLPSGEASGSAQSDISLCENSYSSATRCCGNPMSCAGDLSYAEQSNLAQLQAMMNQPPPTNSSGINDYCRQMQALGGSGGSANSSLASICNNRQQSCTLICSELAQKYLTLMNNCGNCDSYGIYQNAYQTIVNRQGSCRSLAARANQIGSQAISAGAGNSYYGELCGGATNANPQTAAGNSAPTPNSMGNSPVATQNGAGCAANPNSPACQTSRFKEASGSAQFNSDAVSESGSKKKGRFDVPSLDEVFTERVLDTPGPGSAGGVKVKAVANNTGGGIPGLENSSPASLGARGTGGPSAGSPGYPTDILQGTQGGDGYSSPAGQNYAGDGRGQSGYGGLIPTAAAAGNDGNHMLGMDLKQFLPGGSRDPQRRLAGLGPRSEINSKEEDIWRRISSKMEEKCKLGVLIGCR